MAGPTLARKGRACSWNSRLKDGGVGMAWTLGADGVDCRPGLLVTCLGNLGKASVFSFTAYPVLPGRLCSGHLEFSGKQNKAKFPVLPGVREYPHPLH